MKLVFRDNLSIFIIICLGMILLWYAFFYLPKTNNIKKMEDEIRKLELSKESNSIISAYSTTTKEEYEIQKEFNNIFAGLSEIDRLPVILEEIKEIGLKTDIKIFHVELPELKSSSAEEESEKSPIKETLISIDLEGKFVKVQECLSSLIDLSYFGGYTYIKMNSDEELYPLINTTFGCIILFQGKKN